MFLVALTSTFINHLRRAMTRRSREVPITDKSLIALIANLTALR